MSLCCIDKLDVGCPSVCCEFVLLPFVNKEANLANNQAEQSQVRNPNRYREKKSQVREIIAVAEKQDIS